MKEEKWHRSSLKNHQLLLGRPPPPPLLLHSPPRVFLKNTIMNLDDLDDS